MNKRNNAEWSAPQGTIWVCSACGKLGKERDRVGDVSCFLNAVLCNEDSVVLDGGRVVKADPAVAGEA